MNCPLIYFSAFYYWQISPGLELVNSPIEFYGFVAVLINSCLIQACFVYFFLISLFFLHCSRFVILRSSGVSVLSFLLPYLSRIACFPLHPRFAYPHLRHSPALVTCFHRLLCYSIACFLFFGDLIIKSSSCGFGITLFLCTCFDFTLP